MTVLNLSSIKRLAAIAMALLFASVVAVFSVGGLSALSTNAFGTTLNTAEDCIAELSQIAALPDPESVDYSDRASIEAAKQAYNALSDEQKTLVSQSALDRLNDCEEALPVSPIPADVSDLLIVSASNSNFVLDVAGVRPIRGANISIWDANGGSNQRFSLELGTDGFYVLRSIGNPALVLDAAGAKPKLGANVSTWNANGGMNQKWSLVENEDGTVTIASAYDATFVLDAAGATPKRGANVSVWTSNGGMNQKWRLVQANDISMAIASISGMNRNATGAALKPNVELKLKNTKLAENVDYTITYNGSTDVPINPGSYKIVATAKEGSSYIGTYEIGTFTIYAAPTLTGNILIQSAADANFVLDVAGVTPICGANVSVWDVNGGTNQHFKLEADGNGYYLLRNVANPTLVLDAAGVAPKLGANVSTWTANGGSNQRWVIATNDDGTITIHSSYDYTYVLDAAGVAPKRGANVSVWTDNGGLNQKWRLVTPTSESDPYETEETDMLSLR